MLYCILYIAVPTASSSTLRTTGTSTTTLCSSP